MYIDNINKILILNNDLYNYQNTSIFLLKIVFIQNAIYNALSKSTGNDNFLIFSQIDITISLNWFMVLL